MKKEIAKSDGRTSSFREIMERTTLYAYHQPKGIAELLGGTCESRGSSTGLVFED
jgi:hypothetical protein